MMNKELLLYIKTQLDLGTPSDVVKELLVTRGGWRAADVEEALRSILSPIKVSAPIPAVQPLEITKPAPAPVVAPTPVVQPPVVSTPPTPSPVAPPAVARVPGTTIVPPTPTSVRTIVDIAPAPRPVSVPVQPVTPPAPVQQPAPTPQPMPVVTPAPVVTQTPTAAIPQTSISPAPVSVPATSPMMTTMMPGMDGGAKITELPSKSHRGLLATVVILFVLVVGGGAAYAYMNYLSPSPAMAFSRIVPQLTNATTGHYKITAVVDFDKSFATGFLPKAPETTTEQPSGVQLSENTSAQATITLDGSFDRSDVNTTKSTTNVTFTTTALPMTLSFETRSIGASLYVKIPDLSFLTEFFGGNTGAFLPGDWVLFSKDDLTSVTGSEITSSSSLSSETKSKIAAIFLSGGVIVPTVELSKEKYNDTTVHRYQFTVDQKALKQAITQSFIAVSGTPMLSDDVAKLDQSLSSFSITDGELWVGLWDRKPHRIMFNIKPAGDPQMAIKNMKVDIAFTSFGGAVSIETPTNAKPFSTVLDTIEKKSHDAGVKAGLVSVAPLAEIYYSNKRSYTGFCTSIEGAKSLLDTYKGESPDSVYCKDSSRAYAVALPLLSETGFVCMDNTAVGITPRSDLPTGTSCK